MNNENPRITESEIILIKKAQAGDELAFNKIFKKYKRFVVNVINNYIHDNDESKDLVNVVFLKVHQKLSTFKSYDSFGGWLRIIANRTAIDYLRSIKNKRTLFDESNDRLPLDFIDNNTESEVVDKIEYEKISKFFNELSENARIVLKAYYEDGLTVSQIGKLLGMSVNTVKSLLWRSRNKIINKFKTNNK